MISIIIPVYCSAGILPDLHLRIKKTFEASGLLYEIIFIDDGSPDASWPVICSLSKLNSEVIGIRMSRNYGQHNALLCGIRNARGELVITMDDDLQHPPEESLKLIEKLTKELDVVYGYPEQLQHGLLRNFASYITKMVLQKSIGVENARHVSAFRIFRVRLREAFSNQQGPSVNVDVLLSWATSRFGYVLINHEKRKIGNSGYNLRKLLIHAINMITGFSTLPLQFAALVGLLLSVLGFLILAYVVSGWIMHGSLVPGFAFLASMLAIFSGAQMLALGIMGEYLSRIYSRSMNKPSYFVQEEIASSMNCGPEN